MSLDVHLIIKEEVCPTCGRGKSEEEVFWANITHNLNTMAGEAGIYEHLWRPEEIGITTAAQLIEPLQTGIILMEREPERFIALEPSNKWGTYRDFIPWLKNYLEACEKHPTAFVQVSR